MSSSKAIQISQKFIQLGGVRWSHAFPGATVSAGASTRSGDIDTSHLKQTSWYPDPREEPVDREELFGEGQYTEHEVQERKKFRDRFHKFNMFRKKEAEKSIDKAPQPTSDL
uniref:Uncharacterized protein n=1 Tax=Acrobeloides nanus TaxID=290746 RepID=A0A914D7P7_9BILA